MSLTKKGAKAPKPTPEAKQTTEAAKLAHPKPDRPTPYDKP